jgi:DNA ligase-1
VEEGFEGVMVRDKSGPYEPDKRSKYLQKYKEMMEEEFKIVGYHDGVGKFKGTVVWTCEIEPGKTVDVTPKGTLEYRKKLFESANKYIGKKLTVIFFGYTADGSLRFPIGKAIRENY